jgi:hypothetical protein
MDLKGLDNALPFHPTIHLTAVTISSIPLVSPNLFEGELALTFDTIVVAFLCLVWGRI